MTILAAVLLFFSTLPLTTVLMTSGIPVNILPAQTGVIVILLATWFSVRDRPSLIELSLGLFALSVIVTAQVFILEIPFGAIIKNTLVVFMFLIILLSVQWPAKSWITLNISQVNYIFFALFAVISLFLLMGHIRVEGWTERFKGFGSGTVHALVAMVGLLFYFEHWYHKREKSLLTFGLMSALFLIILATQSRGVLITLLLLGALLAIEKYKARLAFYLVPLVLFLFFVPVSVNVENIPVLKRFDIEGFEDLESFTSGRITTQEYIFNWITDPRDSIDFFFGAGLNQVKRLIEVGGLEYPHLDMLYVVYEGGFLLLLLYLLYMYRFILHTRYYLYPLGLLITALHTNAVTSPNALFIFYLLSFNHRVFLLHDELDSEVSE